MAATVLRQCLSKSFAISCALSHGRSPCSSGSRLHGLAWCTVKPQRRSLPVSMMRTNTGPPQNGQSGYVRNVVERPIFSRMSAFFLFLVSVSHPQSAECKSLSQ